MTETRRAKMQVSMSAQEYDAIYRHCQVHKLKPSKFFRDTALAEVEMKMRLTFVAECQEIATAPVLFSVDPDSVSLVERIAILADRMRKE